MPSQRAQSAQQGDGRPQSRAEPKLRVDIPSTEILSSNNALRSARFRKSTNSPRIIRDIDEFAHNTQLSAWAPQNQQYLADEYDERTPLTAEFREEPARFSEPVVPPPRNHQQEQEAQQNYHPSDQQYRRPSNFVVSVAYSPTQNGYAPQPPLKKPSNFWLILEAIEEKRYLKPEHNEKVDRCWATYFFVAIQVVALITEIIVNQGLENISANWALGPSPQTLIAVGGNVPFKTRLHFQDNWWRLLWASFLHVGIFHLLMNLLAQWSVFVKMEKSWGRIRMAAICIAAGFYGNMTAAALRSNVGVVSVGASGMIIGGVGALVGDTIKNWSVMNRPKAQLIYWLLSAVFMLVIGLAPMFDNLVHSSSFLSGILFAIIIVPWRSLKSTSILRWVMFLGSAATLLAYLIVCINSLVNGNMLPCTWCCHFFATIKCTAK